MAHKCGRLVWRWKVLFEPRDLWIGVYWTRPNTHWLRVYICIVPMFPLYVSGIWWRK